MCGGATPWFHPAALPRSSESRMRPMTKQPRRHHRHVLRVAMPSSRRRQMRPKMPATSSASHVRAPRKDLSDTALEDARLRELYQRLIEPVEQHLEGAEELLIIPHKELFEVPWAALVDAHGRYLIERHVLRVAPSLRVARPGSRQDGRAR